MSRQRNLKRSISGFIPDDAKTLETPGRSLIQQRRELVRYTVAQATKSHK